MKHLKKCLQCEKEFGVWDYNYDAAKYCSTKCYAEHTSLKIKKGVKNNRLTIIKEVDPIFTKCYGKLIKVRMIQCLCDCGEVTITRLSYFKTGMTKTCGCLIKEQFLKHSRKTHGLYKSRIYRTWANMKKRCFDTNSKSYKTYGGRGVKVCQEWVESFESFYNWAIKNGYSDNLQIDKDKLGDGMLYSPSTCCWLTNKENQQYKRKREAKKMPNDN